MQWFSLMHVPFEDAANLGVWAAERGHTVQPVHLYAGQPLPPINQVDGVFVMGGPMNIYEEAEYPWLKAEKAFLKSCIEQNKYIVGVCLGAQLIADVLGGRVTGNPHKEIGWYEATSTPAAASTPFSTVLPPRFWAFHWHGDTFAIPPGAVHLAETQACRNQAYLYGNRILGLQFHLEYTQKSIEAMLGHCANELTDGPYIQSADSIRQGLTYVPQTKKLLCKWMDELIKKQV